MAPIEFWKTKSLEAMSDTEWESLCDGCGLCCLHKFEDIDTEVVEFTCVKCQHLGHDRRCGVYTDRIKAVDGCLNVREIPRDQYRWLPETCAYRRLDQGADLPDWHPLRTGSHEAMEASGNCVGDWAIGDDQVAQVDEDFIINLDRIPVVSVR